MLEFDAVDRQIAELRGADQGVHDLREPLSVSRRVFLPNVILVLGVELAARPAARHVSKRRLRAAGGHVVDLACAVLFYDLEHQLQHHVIGAGRFGEDALHAIRRRASLLQARFRRGKDAGAGLRLALSEPGAERERLSSEPREASAPAEPRFRGD
ncbi:MAG: hypothetical protein H6718_03175 [Polyangiaceae bacterium]|nr:hypothetical protein [Polyangiaceae bacterium]